MRRCRSSASSCSATRPGAYASCRSSCRTRSAAPSAHAVQHLGQQLRPQLPVLMDPPFITQPFVPMAAFPGNVIVDRRGRIRWRDRLRARPRLHPRGHRRGARQPRRQLRGLMASVAHALRPFPPAPRTTAPCTASRLRSLRPRRVSLARRRGRPGLVRRLPGLGPTAFTFTNTNLVRFRGNNSDANPRNNKSGSYTLRLDMAATAAPWRLYARVDGFSPIGHDTGCGPEEASLCYLRSNYRPSACALRCPARRGHLRAR